jgi:putative NADPH-quinone reductase
MARRIAIIQGHPDNTRIHFGHALASAYSDAALAAGHEVRQLDVAALGILPLRSKSDWDSGSPPDAVLEAQRTIEWAEHLVILYPLWLGSMPAMLKAFFEQVFRPGFAVQRNADEFMWKKHLKGRSARIVLTMGMPAPVYRWYFRAHSLHALERNILGFCGIGPIRASLIGSVEVADPKARERWLRDIKDLGAVAR